MGATLADLAVAVCEKLGERARKPCNHEAAQFWDGTIAEQKASCSNCSGRGWLPAILLPVEPCREPIPDGAVWGVTATRDHYEPVHPPLCACGGSGVIQRVDEGLLRELLEEDSEIHISYLTSHGWSVFKNPKWWSSSSLLEAAAKALGVEVKG